MGSSYSTPTQIPSPLPILALPTNLTVPRLLKPSSEDSTSHREPTGMSTRGAGWEGCGSSCSANRPTLLRCLYARTVSYITKVSPKYQNQVRLCTHLVFQHMQYRSAQTFQLAIHQSTVLWKSSMDSCHLPKSTIRWSEYALWKKCKTYLHHMPIPQPIKPKRLRIIRQISNNLGIIFGI